MSRKEQAPQRKVVKARGAIPAPVTAPKRVHVPWYRKRPYQAGLAFLLILVVLFVYNIYSDLSDDRERKRLEVRSVEQFERKLQLLNAPLTEVFQSLQTAPDAFLQGALPQEEYSAQANGWLEEFRKLYTGIKEAQVPPELEGLVQAKALYAQGAVIYVDAAKVYIQATALTGEDRQAAIALGRNLLSHGGAVATEGERAFLTLKEELELNESELILPEPQIPEEQAPAPAAPPVPPVVPEGTTGPG